MCVRHCTAGRLPCVIECAIFFSIPLWFTNGSVSAISFVAAISFFFYYFFSVRFRGERKEMIAKHGTSCPWVIECMYNTFERAMSLADI